MTEDRPEENALLTAARSFLAAGWSLIPIKADGTKAPDLPQWKAFQQVPPTESRLCQWFHSGAPRGIGLVHGAVSGHSEALDFDQPGLYDVFADLCRQQGVGDLLDRIPLVETPSGGHHLLYRCTDPAGGNAKLAETTARKTLIETRGEGGYTLAPGSALACHSAGLPYLFLRGGPNTLPILSVGERTALRNTACLFNQYADPRLIVEGLCPKRLPTDGLRPGDDYNGRGDYEAVLERHGWQRLGGGGEKTFWQRPGKSGPGLSATGNYAGSGLFHVFSCNAAPFEPQKSYRPFAVFALLDHGGDFREAARALAQQGFGDALPPSPALHLRQEPIQTPSGALFAVPPAPARRKPLADRMIDLADVEAPGALPYLFGPYLLHGNAHWLTGQTGLGKSTLLFNIACALAEGKSLWGIECTQTRVLYADMESGDVGRAFKINRLYHGETRVRGWLTFLREPVKLPEEMDELLAYVRQHAIQLVIFDTARRCFSVRDENDNAEVYNRVIPTLDALKAAGVASLTLGHPSKNGNGSARGAGAQEDAGDVNLSLTMHKGGVTDAEGVIGLRVTKNRLLGLNVPPLFLKREGEDQFERVEGGDFPTVSLETPGKRALYRAALVEHLEALSSGHASHTELMTAMVQRGYSEATARRAKDELVEEGELLRAVNGGYCLPDPFA